MTETSTVVDRLWQDATLVAVRALAPDVREVVLAVAPWREHLAGQYLDVRLPGSGRWDRPHSYSIANAPGTGPEPPTRVHLVVPAYALVGVAPGAVLQVDGPKGDRMAWTPEETEERPLLLIGGGTGIVPLMAIARMWGAQSVRGRLRMIYSVRSLRQQLFGADLALLSAEQGAEVTAIITGDGPVQQGTVRGSGRLGARDLDLFGFASEAQPECFVSGPASFVESVTRILVRAEHPMSRIRTEVPLGGGEA